MLFVLDVGNRNAVLGVYGGEDPGGGPARLLAHWRVSSNRNQTVDEYGVLFRNLFLMSRIDPKEIKGIVISNVVPPLSESFRELCRKYFKQAPLEVGPGIKTGMPILTDNPGEVGADLIAGSLAAYELYGKAENRPLLAIDFGTAATFCAVSRRGEYLGVAITP